MAGDSQKWILMATAKAPTNMAVIKYWGKRDENLILPINDSISVTLDPDHLSATTTVAVSPSFEKDRMWLNGKEIPLSGGRYQSCLRELQNRAGDFKDERRGIQIKKEDWNKLHLHIVSYNNFPTAAGLASSAAGFACLVFSLAKLMNVKEELGQLSAIARQGSGSACRSLCGGFVKWTMGNEMSGSDSIAVQLANETHWKDLVIIVAVVSSRQKETSSTSGMRESVETSSLIQHRAKLELRDMVFKLTPARTVEFSFPPYFASCIHILHTVVPSRILQMEKAIRSRDFSSFARLTCADSNQFHAVCLDTSPPIFYMNDTSHRIINLVERWNHHEKTPQVAYTFDAGPNAVMIAPNRKVASLLLQRLLFYFPPAPDKELNSYVLGDQTILQEAGIQSLNSIKALKPPSEAKDNVPSQRFAGDVSYFICTRSGKGPVVLEEEDEALISSQTGLPKRVA